MTKTSSYNRSEIMSKAWYIFRRGGFMNYPTFGIALRKAWQLAKEVTAKAVKAVVTQPETTVVSVNKLSIGDTVRIKRFDIVLDRIITAIEPAGSGYNGVTLRFEPIGHRLIGDNAVVANYEPVRRVAVAS